MPTVRSFKLYLWPEIKFLFFSIARRNWFIRLIEKSFFDPGKFFDPKRLLIELRPESWWLIKKTFLVISMPKNKFGPKSQLFGLGGGAYLIQKDNFYGLDRQAEHLSKTFFKRFSFPYSYTWRSGKLIIDLKTLFRLRRNRRLDDRSSLASGRISILPLG